MTERESRPPKWGPIADPVPWPWPDPIPWIWKHVPFPDGDPIAFPRGILEQLRTEDVVALRMAALDAMEQVFRVQLEAGRVLLKKEAEILGKYK